MLEAVVKRYHNNQIDSAQVLQELSEIAKEMRLEDSKSEELGLSPEEYAFYSVLSENKSTRFLDDNKMKELIHTIFEVIRKNATVDWSRVLYSPVFWSIAEKILGTTIYYALNLT
jgi:type I restriction enzyme R subunit